MSIFDEKRAELEQHEFMMGLERGRLAVALDLLSDSPILAGQHGVSCASSRNPAKPALDLQAVLCGMEGAKQLIQSVMEELRAKRQDGKADSRLSFVVPLLELILGDDASIEIGVSTKPEVEVRPIPAFPRRSCGKAGAPHAPLA